jgi:hypothetical protein
MTVFGRRGSETYQVGPLGSNLMSCELSMEVACSRSATQRWAPNRSGPGVRAAELAGNAASSHVQLA